MQTKVINLTLYVILDSNFLLIPSQFQVDIFEELKKLLRIAEHGLPKLRQQASLALALAEKCGIVSVEMYDRENPDDVILRVAKEWRCPVATNDKELRKRLRREGVPVLSLIHISEPTRPY